MTEILTYWDTWMEIGFLFFGALGVFVLIVNYNSFKFIRHLFSNISQISILITKIFFKST